MAASSRYEREPAMNNTDRRLWPFRIRNSFATFMAILVGLLVILAVYEEVESVADQ